MEVIRATPLEHGRLVWPLRPRAPMMLLVMKATYTVVPEGVAELAVEQSPCTGPGFVDDDPDRPLLYPGDFDPLKPVGESFLIGSCHPPGAPVTASEVRFEVGAIQKRVAVFGDRRWSRGMLGARISEPAPFESMPLTWERGLGGPDHPSNPHGRGIAPNADGAVELPNLEDPARLIDGRDVRPAPAGFSPVHPASAVRLGMAGTYDQRWAEQRFPYFPVDLDPSYFLSSPPDQRAEGYFSGAERLFVSHAHPAHAALSTRLPGLLPRAFVQREGEPLDALTEVPLVCDTIVFEPAAMRVTTLHRGLFDVKDRDASDVARLFLMHDVAKRSNHYACRTRLEAHLRLRRLEEARFAALNPSDDEDARTVALLRVHAETLASSPAAQHTLAEAMRTSVGGMTLADVLQPAGAVALAEAASQAPSAPVPSAPVPSDAAPPADVRLADVPAPDVPAERRPVPPADATASEATGDDPEAPSSLSLRVLERYTRGEPLEGDCTGLSLPEADLDGLKAPRALLSGANLSGAQLRGASLAGASLVGARLAGCDLREADLTGADLTKADLSGAQLDGAQLEGATLERARLVRASLRGARLVDAEAGGADFSEADLSDAVADGLDLTRGVLSQARCDRASMVDARLIGVDARRASFVEANVEKLRGYVGARFDEANLSRCHGERARFRQASLVRARFDAAELAGADFSGSNLEGAGLSGCVLTKAKFRGSNLTEARLVGSNLMKAKLCRAILSRTDLSHSSLFQADFQDTIVDRPRLSEAVLTGTKIERWR